MRTSWYCILFMFLIIKIKARRCNCPGDMVYSVHEINKKINKANKQNRILPIILILQACKYCT